MPPVQIYRISLALGSAAHSTGWGLLKPQSCVLPRPHSLPVLSTMLAPQTTLPAALHNPPASWMVGPDHRQPALCFYVPQQRKLGRLRKASHDRYRPTLFRAEPELHFFNLLHQEERAVLTLCSALQALTLACSTASI